MNIFDISMPIHENMPVYKNREEKKPRIIVARDFSSGSAYESELHMNLHTGTHIDFPLHIIDGGNTSEVFDLKNFVAPCVVLDLTHVNEKISDVHLQEKNFPRNTFILLKTKNSFADHFESEFIYLDESGANYLAKQKVTGVGIDALGIERAQPHHETHKILLHNGIAIIEGLRLAEVAEGTYTMIALPLPIKNVEALPARVVLLDQRL